jgi:hypothetical protein
MTDRRKFRALTEVYSQKDIAWARAIVDDAFDSAADKYDYVRRNPILGGDFVPEFDPIQEQKDAAIRAVLARLWHAKKHLDFDLQPLPLGWAEREEMQRRGPVGHMLKWYARSLEARDYDVVEHPSFHDFVCGMMTDIEGFPEFEELRDRFPPRAVPGLDPKVSYWEPLTAQVPIVAKVLRRALLAEHHGGSERSSRTAVAEHAELPPTATTMADVPSGFVAQTDADQHFAEITATAFPAAKGTCP